MNHTTIKEARMPNATPTIGSAATVPQRTTQQRMHALAHANEIRVWRSQLKRDLHARRVSGRQVMAMLNNPPAQLATMKVIDLLVAIPKIGRVRAEKMLRRHAISASKTITGMSPRQRRDLTDALEATLVGLRLVTSAPAEVWCPAEAA